MGHTPHEEIARQQLEKVKQLLIDTDLPLTEVAGRCGFTHVEYMSVVVKKKTGLPPSEYRKRHRGR
jgi:LacI family transcriptional regulator